jgi:charged multivesicular body protein 7
LKILIADLAAQTEVLATRVESCAQEARAAVEKKNPVKAKICLRSKKLAEVNLTRRSDTLVQLEEVYSKIVQAADQVEIVRVMESSTAVMKDLHAQIGGADQVDEIVHNLREQMEATEEIGGLIGEASQVDAVVDEAEVENELKNLLKEQEQQSAEAESIQTQERVSSLPKVPGTVEVEQAPTRPERKEDTEVEDSAAQLGRISLEEENLPAG